MNIGNKILVNSSCVTRKFDVLVVQNNGKRKTKKRAARANLFFANWKKKCAALAISFFC